MDTKIHTTDDETQTAIIGKVNPGVLKVSGRFTALLGFLLDRRWTNPQITALTITSDGGMLDTSSGFANEFIGNVADLERNIRGMSKVAELTPEQTAWLLDRIHVRSMDWRNNA